MKVNVEFIKDRMFDVRISSISEFLRCIDMSYSTFSNKCNGLRDWKLSELSEMAYCLNCKIEDLLKEEEGR
jgi:hypothetical protein